MKEQSKMKNVKILLLNIINKFRYIINIERGMNKKWILKN